MNYDDYIHNSGACPLKGEACVRVLREKNIFNITKNCLSCTGDMSKDEKRINRAYNCVIRRYNSLQYYIYEIKHFYILKYVEPFLKCLLYKFYLELSKIKKLPFFSTSEFNSIMNEETLRCQDRLNDYLQHIKRFINFLKQITSILQSVRNKCKLPDQSYAQQYIIKRINFISEYGQYLEKNNTIIITETYNNLVQDQVVGNNGWYYDLRQYMKRFIKDKNFNIDECLLCNIKKIINHVYPID